VSGSRPPSAWRGRLAGVDASDHDIVPRASSATLEMLAGPASLDMEKTSRGSPREGMAAFAEDQSRTAGKRQPTRSAAPPRAGVRLVSAASIRPRLLLSCTRPLEAVEMAPICQVHVGVRDHEAAEHCAGATSPAD